MAGSARKGSYHKTLVRFAAKQLTDLGADVTVVDLADYPLPILCEDLVAEQGIPDSAAKLYDLMVKSDGLLFACPEYNSSITPLLKNTIDWATLPREGDPSMAAFRGKVAGLLAASSGALGGIRGLVHVRSILGNIGVIVAPQQVAVSGVDKKFDTSGNLTDETFSKMIDQFNQGLMAILNPLVASK